MADGVLAVGHRTAPGRRSVAGNAGFMLASQIVTWSLGLVVAVVLPRHLGPVLIGELRLGLSLWTMAAVVVAAGTHLVLTKEFAQDPRTASSLLGPATTLQLALYGFSWVGIGAFSVAAGYDTQTLFIIGIIGVSTAFTPFVGGARAALQGLERMDYVGVSDVAGKSAYAIFVMAMVTAGAGVHAIAAGSSLAMVVSTALLWLLLRRFGVSWRPQMRGVVRLFRRSRSFMATEITLVAYQQIDVVVISLLAQEEALGWYSTADSLFGSLLFLPSIVLTTLFPVFSRLHAANPTELIELHRRSFMLLLMVAVPVGLGTVAIAEPLSVTLFGSQFAGTGPVLAVMGVVATLTYLTILMGRYALATDRQLFWVRLMVAATVATVLLDLLLVPWAQRTLGNGAIGGALAYLVTESVMLVVGVVVLAPELVCRPVIMRAAKCLVSALAMMGAIWPLRSSFLAVPVVVGVLVYVALVVGLRTFDDEEWQVVMGAGRRLRDRLASAK